MLTGALLTVISDPRIKYKINLFPSWKTPPSLTNTHEERHLLQDWWWWCYYQSSLKVFVKLFSHLHISGLIVQTERGRRCRTFVVQIQWTISDLFIVWNCLTAHQYISFSNRWLCVNLLYMVQNTVWAYCNGPGFLYWPFLKSSEGLSQELKPKQQCGNVGSYVHPSLDRNHPDFICL